MNERELELAEELERLQSVVARFQAALQGIADAGRDANILAKRLDAIFWAIKSSENRDP